jgi:hypothetical protein
VNRELNTRIADDMELINPENKQSDLEDSQGSGWGR